MSDKKRRYDHGGDVERGAEFSWVNTKCKALIVRVEKIDRAPYVEQPDKWDGERPAPRQRCKGKERQDRGTEVAPGRWNGEGRCEFGRHDSGDQEAQSHESEGMWQGENFECFRPRVLEQRQAVGDLTGVALLTQVVPVAWQHINFYGRYEFTSRVVLIDLERAVAALLQSTNSTTEHVA